MYYILNNYYKEKNPIYYLNNIFQDDVMELDLEAELLASTFDKNRSSYSRDNTYFSSQSSACGSDMDSSFYRYPFFFQIS